VGEGGPIRTMGAKGVAGMPEGRIERGSEGSREVEGTGGGRACESD